MAALTASVLALFFAANLPAHVDVVETAAPEVAPVVALEASPAAAEVPAASPAAGADPVAPLPLAAELHDEPLAPDAASKSVVPPATPRADYRPTHRPMPASALPVDTVSASPAPPLPVQSQPRMGWFGIGARAGTARLRLAPPASLVARINQAGGGQSWNAADLALNADARTITPTLHFGGAGYFFKLDFPVSIADRFTMVGLGLYPINVGVYIDSLAVFPYVSLGGTANVVWSKTTSEPGTSNKIIGAVVQARASLGMKYFPARSWALSAEMGYSRWAAGIMVAPPAAGTDGSAQMRGGVGTVIDFAVGAEWL